MRLAMFGATNGTGKILLSRALADKHTVTLLARDSAKLPAEITQNPAVRVVQGDARDSDAVSETIAGADVVLSTLGASNPFEKSDLLGRAMPLIISAMQKNNVRRLIVLGAGGWQPGAMERQGSLRRFFLESIGMRIIHQAIVSQQQQEAVILPSDRDWTIAAPARLVNAKGRGRYRADTEAMPPNMSRIARADVADFMYQQLGSDRYVRRRVYLTW